MELTVVRADAGHVETISTFVAALLDELSSGRGPTAEDLRATAKRLLEEEGVFGLLALSDGQPCGVLMLNECAAIYAGGRFGEITELYVTPDERSHGVAPALLDAARDVARERGWSRFEVGAPDQPTWARTLAFYQREGFEEVGPRLKLML